mgnify:CR=1 FL=1
MKLHKNRGYNVYGDKTVCSSVFGEDERASTPGDRQENRQLHFYRELLNALYSAAHDTIVVTDRHKRVISTNHPLQAGEEKALFDPASEEGRTLTCCELFFEEQQGCDACPVEEVFSTGKPRKSRRVNLGNGCLKEINVAPLLDADGEVQYAVQHVRDISREEWIQQQLQELTGRLENRVRERTQQYQKTIDMLQLNIERRKKLEARMKALLRQLELSRRELNSFNYSVSHDLKAPLRIVENYTQVLNEDFGSAIGEQGRGHLQRIGNAVQRMRALIDDLLTLSRINRLPVERRRIDLSALVREVLEEAEQHFGCRVRKEVEDNVEVYGDQGLLWAAIKNLADNAVKYSMERNDVHVAFGQIRQKNRRVFYIRDNGVGFSMEQAEKLFQPFKRLHSTERFSGTGIGLATVQRVVNRHGGEIWAESSPGEGAVFYFTLSSSPDIFYPYEENILE